MEPVAEARDIYTITPPIFSLTPSQFRNYTHQISRVMTPQKGVHNR